MQIEAIDMVQDFVGECHRKRLCAGSFSSLALCAPSGPWWCGLAMSILASTAFGRSAERWIGSWGAAPSSEAGVLAASEAPPIENTTFRTVVRLSAGGTLVRVRLSNELGEKPLRIDNAHVARWHHGRMILKSDRRILFGGSPSVTIAAGTSIVSDSLPLSIEPLGDLVVSIHVPGPVQKVTAHALGQSTTWFAPGDQTSAETLPVAYPTFVRYVLSGIEVASESAIAVTWIALGDSITDGEQSTFDANHRWTDVMADRLVKTRRAGVGVVNVGISGNRLLRSGWGVSTVARLERDVFSWPNAELLFLLIGINDLGMPVGEGAPLPSLDDFVSAYTEIVRRAHEHEMKVVGATLMPFKGVGPGYYSVAGESMRNMINDWMRRNQPFDALVDLDRLTADPADPALLAPRYDSGDGIHPSDSGYAAIADAFMREAQMSIQIRN